ncbi:uncharacterized protein LOC141497379 [Macrotis lagotis]|uniref:uncharacterized protein LOC141497379 n=1 Tax=Macrotis lagotis TaxID=92651 RepID=UPI003D68FDDF
MIKIKGDLQGGKEDIKLVKETLERDRLVSSLNDKLWTLQNDIQSLHEICRKQGRTLKVEELSIHEMESNISLCKQQLQAEFGCCNQTRQLQLHQLKEKLLILQQELEIRTEELQSSYCSLLQYQSILNKQTCDLEMLHQHCHMKEDEVSIYEEAMEKNKEDNLRLQEKLQLSQKQLALAEDRITSLESSLNIYKEKYQAAVNSLELLEQQMKALEGEVKITHPKEENSKKDQPKEISTECLIFELKETQKHLNEALQKDAEQEDTVQDLRDKLLCSNLKILDHEETLIKLEVDFATYRMSHRQLCCPLDESEDIKQILAHIEEQCEYQCLRVEEYQFLLKDMKRELDRVSEQKKKIMKDLMKLELDMHNLLQETVTQTEWKDGEVKELKEHMKNLEGQLKETQSLCLEKEKIIQEKDDALTQTKQEIIQVQNTLEEKHSDMEKQKSRVEEVEIALQKAKEKEEKNETQYANLDAMVQQLRYNLNEAHQGKLLIAQQLSYVDKQASVLKDNLDITQQKLEDKLSESMEKSELITKLSSELKRYQEDKYMTVNILEKERKNIEKLTSELEETNRKQEDAEREIRDLQKTVYDMKPQLSKSQEKMMELKTQLEEEYNINQRLQKQLKQLKGEQEENQNLWLKWKSQEKELKNEIEALRKEIQDYKKLEVKKLRALEDGSQSLLQKHSSLQNRTESKLETVVMVHLPEGKEDRWKEAQDEIESFWEKAQVESPTRRLSVTEKIDQAEEEDRLYMSRDKLQQSWEKTQYYPSPWSSTTRKLSADVKIHKPREKGLSMRQNGLQFDGLPINKRDTPAQLDMEDEDTIHVIHQQTGGVY